MSTKNCSQRQAGFTLVELLVVLGTIFILVQLSLLNLKMFRERAFKAEVEQTAHDLRGAIENARLAIGIASNLSDFDTWAWANISRGGAAQGFRAKELLSSYSPGKNLHISVEYNGICEAGFWGRGCMVSWIAVTNCQTGYTKTWWNSNDGTDLQWESQNNGAC